MKSMKRIVNKIGYVYCAEIEGQYKTYLQYIAIDSTQLYSQVLRVFETKYPIDYIPDINEIIKGRVSFYTHTYNLSEAIRDGVWYKVGKHSDVGNLEDVYFKGCQDVDGKTMLPRFHWYIWKINQEEMDVGEELPEMFIMADEGSVYPYEWIEEKIRTGKYTDENQLCEYVKNIIGRGHFNGEEECFRFKSILREMYYIFTSEEIKTIKQMIDNYVS